MLVCLCRVLHLIKKKPQRAIFLFIWILFTSSCFETILNSFSNISEEQLSVKASILPSTERRYNQSLKTFLVRTGKPKHENMTNFSDSHHVNRMTKFLFLCLYFCISYTTIFRHITILEVFNKSFNLPFSFTLNWYDVISGSWMTPRNSLCRIFI